MTLSILHLYVNWLSFYHKYLLMVLDRVMLPHANKPYFAACQVKSPGSKYCERYLKHIATQTINCQIIVHTYTVSPKPHLVDLLSTYYTSKFATRNQNNAACALYTGIYHHRCEKQRPGVDGITDLSYWHAMANFF